MEQKAIRRREDILRISGVDPKKCMRCGKCTATCPSFGEMEFHPHEFVYMIESGDIEPLISSPSIYRCLSCLACVDRCPRGVEPARLIEAVRLLVIREKDGDHIKPEDIPPMLDTEIPQQLLVSALRKYSK